MWLAAAALAADPGVLIRTANHYLDTPYRVDGALTADGRYTTFDRPDRTYDSPGLNCSGLVVALARDILDSGVTLDQARRDRLGDSGPKAELGRDWDFGWDLVFNLAGRWPVRVVAPDGLQAVDPQADGRSLIGFNLQDDAAWDLILPQIRPGRLYLAAFSKPTGRNQAGRLHYHVAVLLADAAGRVWLYNSTPTGGAYRMDLTSKSGMNRFKTAFKQFGRTIKRILILEVDPGKE
jgi:hypothetical protein